MKLGWPWKGGRIKTHNIFVKRESGFLLSFYPKQSDKRDWTIKDCNRVSRVPTASSSMPSPPPFPSSVPLLSPSSFLPFLNFLPTSLHNIFLHSFLPYFSFSFLLCIILPFNIPHLQLFCILFSYLLPFSFPAIHLPVCFLFASLHNFSFSILFYSHLFFCLCSFYHSIPSSMPPFASTPFLPLPPLRPSVDSLPRPVSGDESVPSLL